MKNGLADVNNYLFEQLERLNDDESLENSEALEKELKRSKAITGVAQAIVNNASLMLSAEKFYYCEGNYQEKSNTRNLLLADNGDKKDE